jgi:hypothetical protein
MPRPKSIIRFEILYLAAIVLSAVATAMTWSDTTGSPEAIRASQMLGQWFIPLLAVFGFTISLLLWYFTARTPSAFARWVVVFFYVCGLLGFALQLAQGAPLLELTGIFAIVGLVLNTAAVWFLFRPDTTPWFEHKS